MTTENNQPVCLVRRLVSLERIPDPQNLAGETGPVWTAKFNDETRKTMSMEEVASVFNLTEEDLPLDRYTGAWIEETLTQKASQAALRADLPVEESWISDFVTSWKLLCLEKTGFVGPASWTATFNNGKTLTMSLEKLEEIFALTEADLPVDRYSGAEIEHILSTKVKQGLLRHDSPVFVRIPQTMEQILIAMAGSIFDASIGLYIPANGVLEKLKRPEKITGTLARQLIALNAELGKSGVNSSYRLTVKRIVDAICGNSSKEASPENSSASSADDEEEKEMRHQILNGVAKEFIDLFEGLEAVDLQRGRNTASLFIKLVDILTRMRYGDVALKGLKTNVSPVIFDEKLFVQLIVTFKFVAKDGNFNIPVCLRHLETHDHPAISDEFQALKNFDRAMEDLIDHAVALIPGSWTKTD